jgi:Flp pilus assembly protein protease CpaA
MLDYILLAIGIIGFGIGGYLDLKYTEFPDWLPYSMILLALIFRGAFALFLNDVWIFLSSLIVGIFFLGFGLLLYFAKQWGDGDAWLLSALGFLFPYSDLIKTTLPFPLTMLFNFFIISLLYLIAYSIILGFLNRFVWKKFFERLKKNQKIIAVLIIIFFSFSWVLAAYLYYLHLYSGFIQLVLFPFFLTFILLFSYYGRCIEENVFRKQVDVKELKVGDVLAEDRWKGLTEEEIKKLQRKKGKVWIKEGTRFAPVFLITMIVTIFYGDLINIFINI